MYTLQPVLFSRQPIQFDCPPSAVQDDFIQPCDISFLRVGYWLAINYLVWNRASAQKLFAEPVNNIKRDCGRMWIWTWSLNLGMNLVFPVCQHYTGTNTRCGKWNEAD
jgi:hypothetical protein